MITKNKQKIDTLYDLIISTKPFANECAVVFVYNEETLIDDEEHSSECITSIEKDMIINSFRKSAKYVYAINGENVFMDKTMGYFTGDSTNDCLKRLDNRITRYIAHHGTEFEDEYMTSTAVGGYYLYILNHN